jgi:uncharacterized protein (TIGR04255 family)
MNRPANLPDFENPPLNEVVLGVQFAPAPGYQQIYAGQVWELFKRDFPHVEEQPALPPSFETFGLPRPQIGFDLIGAGHDRFWFLTENQHELIQFQLDKFLHNWRKVEGEENEYPRFEHIISKFSAELKTLETFFQKNFSAPPLSVNQCDVTYINFIYASDIAGLNLDDVFSFLKFETSPDEIACNFTKYILNDKGEPRGRVRCILNQAYAAKGPFYRLEISTKGAPDSNSITDALSFINQGRVEIVNLFKEITGPPAHKLWGIK